MLRYLTKRVITAIFTAFIVATLTFFIMNMVPGGPFLAEKAVTPQAQAAMEAKYGLDKPLGQQYLTYMNGLLHGDLGLSVKKKRPYCKPDYLYKIPGICTSWRTCHDCCCSFRNSTGSNCCL